ncbi:hypothetical protein [uncultured Rhodoblastus sp.]|uniref:hypothetical protein n=1 Tax=uncultured Rhodoblastus sp. TaxID=543037 RepID=UPI0025E39DCC|nr:hypothetical protein [uncultured Rhodoblastus sp.]
MTTPVVMMVLGRQRVGKTSFLNTVAQYLKARGAEFEIWDGDQQNTSYNLSLFHRNALRPPEGDPEEVKVWLEQRFSSVIENRTSAILDIGGGDTPLGRLVQDVPVVETLEGAGVRVVLVHVVGPETPDLDYLGRFSENNLFVSKQTLVVLNAGLVLSGRSVKGAFAQTMTHPTISRVLSAGGHIVDMPRLACMSEVADRGLSFEDAMSGAGGSVKGLPPLNLFDRARVRKWWQQELPNMFDEIPADWLPATRDSQTDAAE